MVTFKKDGKYLEVNVFDALFSRSGNSRRKQLVKRFKNGVKKESDPSKDSDRKETGPAAPAQLVELPPIDAPPPHNPVIEVTLVEVQPGTTPALEIIGELAPVEPVPQTDGAALTPAATAPETAAAANSKSEGIQTDADVVPDDGTVWLSADTTRISSPVLAGSVPALQLEPIHETPIPALPADGGPGPSNFKSKDEWDDAKIERLCDMKSKNSAWDDIATALKADLEMCIQKYSEAPDAKKTGHPQNTTTWDDAETAELMRLKDDAGKGFPYIAAALSRSEQDVKTKHGELKKVSKTGKADKKDKTTAKVTVVKTAKPTAVKGVSKPSIKGKEKAVSPPVSPPEASTGVEKVASAPEMPAGIPVDNDLLSAYDPDGPPDYTAMRNFVERYDDSKPLRDQYARLLDEKHADYITKLACFYDKEKWVQVGSRLFDETGIRLDWRVIKEKFGNLRFP